MNLAAPPPETEQSNTAALILSAAVHLLLLGALFFGVQWKSQAPSSVEIEVWRAASAPAPLPVAKPESPPPKPEPKPVAKVEPPPPIKPDIAIKEKEKPKKEDPKKPEPRKEEPRKPEPKKPEPKPEPKREEPDFKKQLADEQKHIDQQKALQAERDRAAAEANQRAQIKAEQAAAGRKRGLENYIAKIGGAIRTHIVLPPSIQGNPEAIFTVTQLPSGDVIDVKVRKSSGNSVLDAAIERAIHKASPLPKPDDPGLFDRELKIPYRPLAE